MSQPPTLSQPRLPSLPLSWRPWTGAGVLEKLASDRLLAGAALLVTLAHGLPYLDSSPPISFDEGWLLQAPSNLLHYGVYGTRTLDGFLPFDTHLTTGPTVLLPIWGSFLLLGEGVEQARLVVLLYGALAVAAFYALLRLQAGKAVALLGALLLSFSLYPYHRVALGEGPGLFWLLLGGWLWLREVQGRPRPGALAVAGLAFGAAAVTKLALGPIAAASILGSWCLGRAGASPRVPLFALWLPLVVLWFPLLAWYGVQGSLLGWEEMVRRTLVVGEYQPQMGVLDPHRLVENARALPAILPPGLLPWLAPALLLGVARLSRGAFALPPHNFLLVLTVVTSAYYLLSVGWPRFSFWAMAMSTGLVALLAGTVLDEVGSGGQAKWRHFALLVGASVLGLVFLIYPATWTLAASGQSEADPQRVARFLMEQAGPEEVLGSTEWEIDFLTKMVFKHPPPYVATTPRETIARSFDWSWPGIDWVVVGGVGKFLRADAHLVTDARFVERFRAGPYRVFQRQAGPTPGWTWNRNSATATSPLSQGPVGQSFLAPYDVLTEVRVLLAGEGRSNNASVRLTLLESPSSPQPLATAELPGSYIVENKWYAFPLGAVPTVKGAHYYFELESQPQPGQSWVTAWYNSAVDYYPEGGWYRDRKLQAGDLYFGVLGHNGDLPRRRDLPKRWGLF